MRHNLIDMILETTIQNNRSYCNYYITLKAYFLNAYVQSKTVLHPNCVLQPTVKTLLIYLPYLIFYKLKLCNDWYNYTYIVYFLNFYLCLLFILNNHHELVLNRPYSPGFSPLSCTFFILYY